MLREVLLKLEWVKSETEITRAAYLLFAKDPQCKFSQAIVHAGAFKDDGAIIYDSHDSKGNIQDQVDDALAFIKKSIHCALVITPGKAEHDSVWDYPLNAVRETLANAICHRDYGAPYDVQVNIYEDSLRISSPGQLPFDMPLSLLMDPRHASRPRNKIIAQAFFDMGVIERYGGGIKRIKKDCDRNGNTYPEWIDRTGEFVTEYRPRDARKIENGGEILEHGSKETESGAKEREIGSKQTEVGAIQNTEMVTDKVTEVTEGDNLNETEKAIVRLIANDSHITQAALAKNLGMSRPYIARLMLDLQDKKIIRRMGPDFGGQWIYLEGKEA